MASEKRFLPQLGTPTAGSSSPKFILSPSNKKLILKKAAQKTMKLVPQDLPTVNYEHTA